MLKMTKVTGVTLLVFVLAVLMALPVSAQEIQVPGGEDDGRLNINYWMDGFGLYCADANRQPASSYANGGGFLLLAPSEAGGDEMLFIPEDVIEAGMQQVEQTGEFALLGQAEEDAWFYPEPAIYYLPSGEFQINIAKSSPDDLREGKLYTFYWTECRDLGAPAGE